MIGNLPPIGAISTSYTIRPDAASVKNEATGSEGSSRAQASNTSEEQDARKKTSTSNPLSEEDQRRVSELQKRDREVRAHEMAHVAAGGSLVLRGASFSYETGPDGQRYAVGGEVTIDTSEGRTPQETLEKAARIRAAALAPADPSPQDREVAAMATQMAMRASMELATQQRENPAEGEPVSATSAARGSDDARAERMQTAYGVGTRAGDELVANALSVFA